MAAEFDVCWSTVIAAADTHADFGEAPDNGWVQRCRLGSGHPGIHASDAGAGPRGGFRLWLQWSDDDAAQRLTELEPCPVIDSTDLVCEFFAGHGGPHRYIPTTSTPRFGSHYRPDTTVSVNGSDSSGSVATAVGASRGTSGQSSAADQPSALDDQPAEKAHTVPDRRPPAEERRPQHESTEPDPEPESQPEPAAIRAGTGRRSRHSGQPANEGEPLSEGQPPDEVAEWMAGHVAGRVRPVDEVLLDLVDLLSELAAAVKARRES